MADVITDSAVRSLKGPNQIFYEWKDYLLFVKSYFEKRGILNPVVVEIGVQNGRQKPHYQKFLDAVHIGIDISDKFCKPDILGDSHAPETMAKLKEMLAGREINLLFIDACHTYEDAMAEYESYGPLSKDIIAFHDIRHILGIGKLWHDINYKERFNPNRTSFSIGGWGGGWCELGIGVIVKHPRSEINDVVEEFQRTRKQSLD